jgi:hypothetical protein
MKVSEEKSWDISLGTKGWLYGLLGCWMCVSVRVRVRVRVYGYGWAYSCRIAHRRKVGRNGYHLRAGRNILDGGKIDQSTFPLGQINMLTLEMACDVAENAWIPIDVESLDIPSLSTLADLVLEEACKVGGSY